MIKWSANTMLRLGFVALLVGISACGGTAPSPAGQASKTEATPASGGKFDFDAVLRREIQPLRVQKFAHDVVSGEVEAASAPQIERTKESIKIVIPIGTQAPVECYVYHERTDGASTIWQVVDAVKKKIDVRLFEPTDVFVAAGHAALAAHAIYVVKQAKGDAGGELKLIYYENPLVSTLCTHDEAGYSGAFKRLAKGLFESLKRSDRRLESKPSKREVSVIKVNGRPTGYSDNVDYDSGKDTVVSESVTAKLLPRSPNEVMVEDTITTETSDKAGQLLEYVHVGVSGTEVALVIKLKRLGAGEYSYSGKQNGKPINGKFKTKSKLGPATGQAIAKNIRELLLSGKATSFKSEEYSPDLDPTAPIEALYEIESKEQRKVRSSFGPAKIEGTVDEHGELEKSEMHMGSSTVTEERLSSEGKR
jgi:hypothetical protein